MEAPSLDSHNKLKIHVYVIKLYVNYINSNIIKYRSSYHHYQSSCSFFRHSDILKTRT